MIVSSPSPLRLPARVPRPIPASADVVSVLSGIDEQWVDYRGRRFGRWLSRRGIRHTHLIAAPVDALAPQIRASGARVVISEAQVLRPAAAAELAAALPEVRIVSLPHGVLSWCASSWPDATYDMIRQARDLPNAYVGTVHDPAEMAWLAGAKVVHLPNPIEIPAGLTATATPPGDDVPLCVSVIARQHAVKNWGGMVAALAMLARRRPLRVIVRGRNHTLEARAHLAYLADLGVEAEIHDYGDWGGYLSHVAANVHIGLACGFTDSLNLVAAEHCLLSIPVVGSPALDWLPFFFRADPQRPSKIADTVEYLAHDLTTHGAIGRAIVSTMAAANEETLLWSLRNLIERENE